MTAQQRYIRLLETWPAAARRDLYLLPGSTELGCYGPGNHGHWAMQANNTAASALAVLAVDPSADFARAGMSRDETLVWALRLIRFSLRSHHAGGGAATDLKPWGHSWISGLCLERMMHGIEAADAFLDDRDRETLRRVLISESDWLLDCYQRGSRNPPGAVTAGLTDNNHPENNIWNGCMLYRAARLAPDAPRVTEYLAKSAQFLLNGISIESDASSDECFRGRPLSEWHVGANFFPSFALNHHGYMNVGYMAICLSNIAMMHFSCRRNGWELPPGLMLHARELWELVKTCTFPDGRLMRIGGDTRARYCYCQDYALPVWLWALDRFGDTTATMFEKGWLGQVEREVAANGDGAFLSGRLARLADISPLYYTRLEGDRAGTLAMGAWWRRDDVDGRSGTRPTVGDPTDDRPAVWSDDFHGSCLVRGRRRMASWTWRAGEKPQGLCLPPDGSDLAEWRHNLAGRISGIGMLNETQVHPGQCEMFDGGFATCGWTVTHTRQPVSEGDLEEEAARIDTAFVALPDDASVVVMQRARTCGRVYLREVKGLLLQIPNDVFNGMRRVYCGDDGVFETRGCPGTAETLVAPGNWLNVDDRLSVVRVYGPPLTIYRPADRQVCIKASTSMPHTALGGGTLYVDEICCGCSTRTQAWDAGAVLFDVGAVLLAGVSAERTREWMHANPPLPLDVGDAMRAVALRDANGRDCCVIANFSDRIAEADLPDIATVPMISLTHDVALERGGGRRGLRVHVPPQSAVVLAANG